MSGTTENSEKKHQSVAQFKSFPPSNSTLCPTCDYSLIGLPADHRCPECGFAYDRSVLYFTKSNAVGFKAISRNGQIGISVFMAILLCVAGFDALGLLGFTRAVSSMLRAFVGMFLIAYLGLLVGAAKNYFDRRDKNIPFLYITPSGLIYCDGRKNKRLNIGYDKISAIYLNDDATSIFIKFESVAKQIRTLMLDKIATTPQMRRMIFEAVTRKCDPKTTRVLEIEESDHEEITIDR